VGAALGQFHVGQHELAALVVEPADFGELLPTRGAMEQARAQSLFDRADVLACHGGRHAAGFGGRRKAAGVHHAHEHRHVRQGIHD